MASPLGAIRNESASLARVTGVVKAGQTVVAGLVYIDGANGIKNAPTDGSKLAKDLFWCPKNVGSATETKDKKVTIYDLDGLMVIGKSDGIIPLGGEVKASTTSAHGGQFITNPEPTSAFTAADGSTVDGTYGAEEAAVLANNVTRIAELVAREAAIRAWVKDTVGHYIGHEDEILEGKTPTASADEDEDCVFILRRGK
ncbi:MAG: hypothetical protein K5785_00940 [Nitrosarchaeum sp.]|nr:hypothetical protein [Nitrosarchaeum sp.]